MHDERLTRIEQKIDNMDSIIRENVLNHRERIVKLETHQRGFLTGLGALWALAVAYITSIFDLKL